MLSSWGFLIFLEDFFSCAAIEGRAGVGNVFSVVTLEGVAAVSSTVFEILVCLCCIILGGDALSLLIF